MTAPPTEPGWRRVVRAAARSGPLVGTYLAGCDFVGRTPRNDIAWRHLDRWLAEAAPFRPTGPARRRLLLFTTQPHWVDLSLALATVLVGRGDAVDVVWGREATHLPDVPPPLIHHHWLRAGDRAQRTFAHPHLRLLALDRLPPAAADDLMHAAADAQALADASYAVRKERLDLSPGSGDALQLERRRRINLDTLRRLGPLLDHGGYDRLLLPSGGILEFGALHRLATARGIPATTYEFPDALGRMLISPDAPVTSLPTKALWDAADHALSDRDRDRIVAQLIEARQSRPNDPAAPSFQRAAMTSPEEVRTSLGLSAGRRTILVCCNVPYDAIFYAAKRKLFAGMWAWLGETVRFLAGRPDCTVIVRAHPAEPRFDTPETAEALLREALPTLPDNVRFLEPLSPINTFAIMQVADAGAVYASTTGLEMAMRGLPVVCGNPDQHYNGKGFTIDPEDRHGYFAALDRLAAGGGPIRLTPDRTDLALRYADLYFNEWPRRFPWHLSTFWSDVRAWPPARLLGAEGLASYGETIAAI